MGGLQHSEAEPSLTAAAELGMCCRPCLQTGKQRQARRLAAGRILEGFQTILVIWSPRPFWSPIKLRSVNFPCMPEGYQKDNGRVTDILKRPVREPGVALQIYPHAGRMLEAYRKDTRREEQMSAR